MRFSTLTFFGILFTIQTAFGQQTKINGISFVASRDKPEQKHVQPVIEVNANYAAVMPFGFIRSLDSPTIVFNTDRQWFGETRAGVKHYTEILQKNNIKVLIKPQIWIWQGEYTGYLKMETEEKWKELEDSYSAFILDYARLAEETNAEMFCIGTELETFIEHRPLFWEQLITQVKAVYKGELTYAANWDAYKRVNFWKKLDYIGVDAYFPISEEATPSVQNARLGWQNWKQELLQVSTANDRPILFTEFGYRSRDFSGKEPWTSDRSITSVNLKAQDHLTQAIFEEFWKEDWFAGGFIWKWFIHHKDSGGAANNRFTPQNKPVEETIRKFYEK